jgi:hypothetical protein
MKPKPVVANLVQRGKIPEMLNGDFSMKSKTGTEAGKALPSIATPECCPKRANFTQIGRTLVISLLLDALTARSAGLQSLEILLRCGAN